MARTVSQIQSDIDSVRAELASSETMIRRNDGSEMQTRTTESALKALTALQTELALASVAPNVGRPRQIRLSGSSGFGGRSGC